MKKILTFCVTTVLLLGVFFSTMPSCTRESDRVDENLQLSEEESLDDSFALLSQQIDEYNASYVACIEQNQTRGWLGKIFKKIWKCLKVGLAEIIGGIGGTVAKGDWAAGSAALSALASTDKNKSVETDLNKQIAGVKFAPVGELILLADNILDSIGIRHNTLIKAVYRDDPRGFFTCTDKELQQRIFQKHTELYGPVPVEVISALPTLQKKVEQVTKLIETEFLSHVNENSTDEELIEQLRAAINVTALRIPEYKNELMVLRRYLEIMVQLPDNDTIEVYTDGFKQIINSSELPKSSIVKINSGISVAANSNYLWQEINE